MEKNKVLIVETYLYICDWNKDKIKFENKDFITGCSNAVEIRNIFEKNQATSVLGIKLKNMFLSSYKNLLDATDWITIKILTYFIERINDAKVEQRRK